MTILHRRFHSRNYGRSFIGARERSNHGSYIVEALVACLVTSIISAMLVHGYSQISTMGTKSQTQLTAVAIAQEIFDQVRSQQFTVLAANLGTHTPVVVGASPTGDVIFPRPLLRDTTLNYYNTGNVNDKNNVMQVPNNTIKVVLAQADTNAQGQTSAISGWLVLSALLQLKG